MWFKDLGKFATDKFKSFVPLDTKNQEVSLEDMLKNIDIKKDKKPEPLLIKKPLEAVVAQVKPKDLVLPEKRANGWEDDLEIELEDQNTETCDEKKEAEPEEEKKSTIFSRIMEVKSFVAAKKEESKALMLTRPSNESSQKLEEEIRTLREKLHRSFMQESGLEMLCRVEKSEVEAEKARNIADFKGKMEEIRLKECDLQRRIEEMKALERKIEFKQALAVSETELDELLAENGRLYSELEDLKKARDSQEKHYKEVLVSLEAGFFAKIGEKEREIADLSLQNANHTTRIQKDRLIIREMANKLNEISQLRTLHSEVADKVRKELNSRRKVFKDSSEDLSVKLQEFLAKIKGSRENSQRRIDTLTEVSENLKRTHRKELDKLAEEKRRSDDVSLRKIAELTEELKVLSRERQGALSELAAKGTAYNKLQSDFQALQALQNKQTFEFSAQISKLQSEISCLSGSATEKSQKIEDLGLSLRRITDANASLETERNSLRAQVLTSATVLKHQEKSISQKESVIINLEIELETLKKENADLRRINEKNLPLLECLKKQSTPHWGVPDSGEIGSGERKRQEKMSEAVNENQWGLEDEDLFAGIEDGKQEGNLEEKEEREDKEINEGQVQRSPETNAQEKENQRIEEKVERTEKGLREEKTEVLGKNEQELEENQRKTEVKVEEVKEPQPIIREKSPEIKPECQETEQKEENWGLDDENMLFEGEIDEQRQEKPVEKVYLGSELEGVIVFEAEIKEEKEAVIESGNHVSEEHAPPVEDPEELPENPKSIDKKPPVGLIPRSEPEEELHQEQNQDTMNQNPDVLIQSPEKPFRDKDKESVHSPVKTPPKPPQKGSSLRSPPQLSIQCLHSPPKNPPFSLEGPIQDFPFKPQEKIEEPNRNEGNEGLWGAELDQDLANLVPDRNLEGPVQETSDHWIGENDQDLLLNLQEEVDLEKPQENPENPCEDQQNEPAEAALGNSQEGNNGQEKSPEKRSLGDSPQKLDPVPLINQKSEDKSLEFTPYNNNQPEEKSIEKSTHKSFEKSVNKSLENSVERPLEKPLSLPKSSRRSPQKSPAKILVDTSPFHETLDYLSPIIPNPDSRAGFLDFPHDRESLLRITTDQQGNLSGNVLNEACMMNTLETPMLGMSQREETPFQLNSQLLISESVLRSAEKQPEQIKRNLELIEAMEKIERSFPEVNRSHPSLSARSDPQDKLEHLLRGSFSKNDPEDELGLELSVIRKENQTVSDFLEKQDSGDKRQEIDGGSELDRAHKDEIGKKNQDLFLLSDMQLNKSDSIRLQPNLLDKATRNPEVIKEVDEENHWGIEDMIDFGSPSKPEIKVSEPSKVSDPPLKVSVPLQNFADNIAKAFEVSQDFSHKAEEYNIKWEDLNFGKCEVSKNIDKSEVKSSKDSYCDLNTLNAPAIKRVSDEIPGLSKIQSLEAKISVSSGGPAGKKAWNLTPKTGQSSQGFIINKELMMGQKSGLTKLGKTPNFLFEAPKKHDDIDLEDILGNQMKRK